MDVRAAVIAAVFSKYARTLHCAVNGFLTVPLARSLMGYHAVLIDRASADSVYLSFVNDRRPCTVHHCLDFILRSG